MSRSPLRAAVFASGGGTNLQSLLDHREGQELWRVALLVMNREAGARARADDAGIPTVVIPTRDRDTVDVASDILVTLADREIDLVLLAGYLRLVPGKVVQRYAGRMLNVHPAILPDFGGKGMHGLNVHRAVIDSGEETSGATVHFVTEAYDDGDILAQWHVEVRSGDTPEVLAARVLRVEHQLYPRAVDHLCAALIEGRRPARMKDVWLDEPPGTA